MNKYDTVRQECLMRDPNQPKAKSKTRKDSKSRELAIHKNQDIIRAKKRVRGAVHTTFFYICACDVIFNSVLDKCVLN